LEIKNNLPGGGTAGAIIGTGTDPTLAVTSGAGHRKSATNEMIANQKRPGTS